jgi:Cu(I)/Ag(I) efflux system membrane fusion protein
MKTRTVVLASVVAAVTLGSAGYGLWRLGMTQGMKMSGPATGAASDGATQKAGDVDPGSGKKVLYWHDPMVPGQKFDKPGKSPFMDMQLVPVYADSGGQEGGVAISSRVQQNLGVRTAEVVTGTVAPMVEAVGSVAYNERDVALVQARSNGFLEKLYVRAPLDAVHKGQPLAELYVPEWVAAQEEFLSFKRMEAAGLEALRDAARQRMRLAGMSDDQVRLVETSGKVHPRLTLTAPIGGVVAELTAREGMTVMAGAPLFRINGLASIWVNAEVPENVASQVRPGNAVEARTPALPESRFKGRVSAILPEVNPATRTMKMRIELANPGGQLVPGMFATVNFTPASKREALMVPTEAVIQTGKRTVVVLAEAASDGKQRFRPVDVEIGAESNGMTEIRKGVERGQKVVVSGQFLIDSEASLKATATRLADAPTAAEAIHSGEGRVEKIDKESVTLSHGPIPSLQWGAMTMDFKLPKESALPRVKEGDRVRFAFKAGPKGEFEITALEPMVSEPVKSGAKR